MKVDRIEYYAGYQGEEKPLAVYVGEERIEVTKIILQERVLDSLSGRLKEIFHCLLANGEKIKVERELD